jgi:3-phenylpropionate/trans-cinnamate dioxygenase ferredoxin subunit
MNDWVDVCAVEDVPEPGALRVMLGAEPVAVVRSEGQLYAIRDVCSHADVALSEGDVEGCFIE